SKMEQYRLLPQNIYNMDKKGFCIGQIGKIKRVFSKKAYKRGLLKGAGINSARMWVTVLASVSIVGVVLPPTIIFEAQTTSIQDT
ncbi:hypothetical protein EV356DRAFT_452972, partial [Viridothelium virens]